MNAGAYRITRTLPPSATADAIELIAEERDVLRAEVERLRAQVLELQLASSHARLAAAPRPIEVAAPVAYEARRPSLGSDRRIVPNPEPPVSGPSRDVVSHQQQGLDFGSVVNLTPSELDALPYGLITLDSEGRVLHYNDTESRMVGLPKEQVLGRSFFQEVAPCARVREFEGRFRDLVRDPLGVRVQTFDFVFRFPRQEQQVTIVITPARARGQFHVAMLRRSVTPRIAE